MKKKKRPKIEEDYLRIQRKLSREIELERNGGRWIAVDRPHKSKKDYNRRLSKKVSIDDFGSLFIYVAA